MSNSDGLDRMPTEAADQRTLDVTHVPLEELTNFLSGSVGMRDVYLRRAGGLTQVVTACCERGDHSGTRQ